MKVATITYVPAEDVTLSAGQEYTITGEQVRKKRGAVDVTTLDDDALKRAKVNATSALYKAEHAEKRNEAAIAANKARLEAIKEECAKRADGLGKDPFVAALSKALGVNTED